ncbi:aminopeptidase [Candidatus Woesearchaeota archaeon]|nr:aminopeptidase [Candidatus Woesearchaeota archaeon]
MDKPVNVILDKCMGYKDGETVLIVTDDGMHELADKFYHIYNKKGVEVSFIRMKTRKVNGEEPSTPVSSAMRSADIAILLTSRSISHTKARRRASENGVRIASMPTATKDMIQRTIDIDYDAMFKLNNQLADLLEQTKIVRVTSKLGTDIIIPKVGVRLHGRTGGSFIKKGSFGNLPDGEICFAPVQDKTQGVFYIDGSTRTGMITEPIKVSVKDGYAVAIEGDEAAKQLKKVLDDTQDKGAYNIAELGIGTNPNAILTGNVLEDEKIYGTVHIAFGNNLSFGGKIDVPLHIDNVILKPTMYFDDKLIMKDGVYKI